MRSWLWASWLLLGSGAASAQSTPPPERHRLVYAVPEGDGCASEDEFRAQLEEQLGRAVFDPAALSSVEVTTTRQGTGWALRLGVVDAGGQVRSERALEAPDGSCQTVLAGAVLALELLLEEGTEMIAQPPEIEPAPEALEPVPQPIETLPEEAPPEELPPATSRPDPVRHWEVSAGGAGYFGVLPDFALGGRVGAGYLFDVGIALRLDVTVTHTISVVRPVDDVSVELSMALAHGSFGASYDLYRNERQRYSIGLGAHYGSLGLDVSGADRVGYGRVAWAALGARGTGRVLLWDPVALTLGAEALTPLLDDEFAEVGGTVLTTLPSFGAILFLEIGAVW